MNQPPHGGATGSGRAIAMAAAAFAFAGCGTVVEQPGDRLSSAYERARGAKVMITMRDQGHDTMTDNDLDPEKPGSSASGRRVPMQRDETAQEKFTIAAWAKDDGGYVFLPHQMRNYFITAWFDWQLKGDQQQRAAIVQHPFAEGVQQMLSEGVAP